MTDGPRGSAHQECLMDISHSVILLCLPLLAAPWGRGLTAPSAVAGADEVLVSKP